MKPIRLVALLGPVAVTVALGLSGNADAESLRLDVDSSSTGVGGGYGIHLCYLSADDAAEYGITGISNGLDANDLVYFQWAPDPYGAISKIVSRVEGVELQADAKTRDMLPSYLEISNVTNNESLVFGTMNNSLHFIVDPLGIGWNKLEDTMKLLHYNPSNPSQVYEEFDVRAAIDNNDGWLSLGTLTYTAQNPIQYYKLEFGSVPNLPEPSTLALATSGAMAGVGFAARAIGRYLRRRREVPVT